MEFCIFGFRLLISIGSCIQAFKSEVMRCSIVYTENRGPEVIVFIFLNPFEVIVRSKILPIKSFLIIFVYIWKILLTFNAWIWCDKRYGFFRRDLGFGNNEWGDLWRHKFDPWAERIFTASFLSCPEISWLGLPSVVCVHIAYGSYFVIGLPDVARFY